LASMLGSMERAMSSVTAWRPPGGV
jgi:hypothetical protein